MDQPLSNFERILKQAHAGQETAARELHDMCRSRLFRAVRRRLPRQLRSKFDSEEFVQDAWTVYWERYKHRASIPHPQAFSAFLARIADRIVIDAVRQRLMGVKRPVEPTILSAREEPVDPRQKTPSQTVMRREIWQRYLDTTPSNHRQILELFEQGWKSKEIARHVGRERRTVNRVILNMIRYFSRHYEEFWG